MKTDITALIVFFMMGFNLCIPVIQKQFTDEATIITVNADPSLDDTSLGWETLDNGTVFHMWNQYDDYYFNRSNGIQFSNHYEEYWTKNVLMLGYYNGGQWNLLYRVDELSGFNEILDNSSEYINVTLWKDLSYTGYDFRLALRYHLGVNDSDLTIVPYIKNLGIAIPFDIGFGWEMKDIQIDNTFENDYFRIDNNASSDDCITYSLYDSSLDESYNNLTHWYTDDNQDWIWRPNTIFYIDNHNYYGVTNKTLYLKWNHSLNYKLTVKARTGQYNAPVTLFIKVGTLGVSQEKATNMYWYDADVSYGTPSPFTTGITFWSNVATIDTNKIVVAFCNDSDGESGQAIVGTVSGTAISWGAESEFISDHGKAYGGIGVCPLGTNKFVVAYVADALSDAGYARVATVDGTTISWGDVSVFESGDAEDISCCQLDTDKFVICYNDETNSDTATGIIGTASGTTLSWGAENDVHTTDYWARSTSCAKIDSDTFVMGFSSDDENKQYVVAGDFSGDTITWGSPVEAPASGDSTGLTYSGICSPDTNKFVMSYLSIMGATKYQHGEAIAGTVSGTDITLGTAVMFKEGSAAFYGCIRTCCVDIDSTHVLIAYVDSEDHDGESNFTTVTWADRSLSYNTSDIFETGNVELGYSVVKITHLGSGKVAIAYTDNDDADKGKVVIGDAPFGAVNNAPTQSAQKIWNSTTNVEKSLNATGVSLTPTCFNVTIADTDSDYMNVTIKTNESGTWTIVNATASGMTDGVYHGYNTSWVDAYNTKYWISFNVSDDSEWCNETFNFTTTSAPEWVVLETWNITLGNMSISPYTLDTWNLTIGNSTIASYTLDTWNMTLGNMSVSPYTLDTWNLTFGNSTISPFTIDTWNLTIGNLTTSPYTLDTWNITLSNLTISPYTLDTWNVTLGNTTTGTVLDTWNLTLSNMTISSYVLDTWNITLSNTSINNVPTITNPYPANQSTGIPVNPTLNITINDADGESMNITWYSNNSGSWVAFATGGLYTIANYSYGFEVASDLDNWTTTGIRYSSATYAHSGSYSLEIEGASEYASHNLSLDDYSKVNISWWNYPYSIETNEYLYLRFYNGTGWSTIRTVEGWQSGIEATDTHYYNELDTGTYTFNDNCKICWNVSDGDINDRYYLDDINITYGYTGSMPNGTYTVVGSNFTNHSTTYYWNVSVNDGTSTNNSGVFHFTTVADSTPPTVLINFAGNLSDSGGPYWRPPGELTQLTGVWSDGYYTNDSRQHEDWIYINLSVNDSEWNLNGYAVNNVWLNWLNGTTWTNWTYAFANTVGDYWEYNTSGNIQTCEGYDYSFNIVANDTASNSNTIWWNKTGHGGGVHRRYIQLNCTPINITYSPYYFYEAYYTDTGWKKDRLHHDQGIDNLAYDSGYLYNTTPTDVVASRSCIEYVGYWFDNSTCIEPFTLDDIYYHIWWFTDNPEIDKIGWHKTREGVDGTTTDYYTSNDTLAVCNITYNGEFFKLDTNLLDVTNHVITDNNIYECSMIFRDAGAFDIEIISNRSFTSFVIFNVPDNATLNASHADTDSDSLSDWTELYVTYTNPFLADTDNDGVNDYDENLAGSNPNNYTSMPAQEWVVLETWNITLGNMSISPYTLDTWNLTLGNMTIAPFIIDTWNVTLGNSTITPFTIDTWNITMGNLTISSFIIDTWNLTLGNMSISSFTIDTWNITLSNTTTGTILDTWNLTIGNSTLSPYTLDTWNITLGNTTTGTVLDTWNLTIGNLTLSSFVIDQWNLTFSNTTTGTVLETWNVTLGNMSISPVILDTWNLTLSNLTISPYTLDTWNITIGNMSIASFTIDTWNLTLSNTPASYTLDTWNVTLSNTTLSYVLDTWNITLSNTSLFIIANITATPSTGTISSTIINITCNVTSTNAIVNVTVNMTGGTYDMSNIGDLYYYASTYNTTGIHYYHIYANDTSGDRLESSVHSFEITGLSCSFTYVVKRSVVTVTPTIVSSTHYKWTVEHNSETEWIPIADIGDHKFVFPYGGKYRIILTAKNETTSVDCSRLITAKASFAETEPDEETPEEEKKPGLRNVYTDTGISDWIEDRNLGEFILIGVIALIALLALFKRRPKKLVLYPIKKEKKSEKND